MTWKEIMKLIKKLDKLQIKETKDINKFEKELKEKINERSN